MLQIWRVFHFLPSDMKLHMRQDKTQYKRNLKGLFCIMVVTPSTVWTYDVRIIHSIRFNIKLIVDFVKTMCYPVDKGSDKHGEQDKTNVRQRTAVYRTEFFSAESGQNRERYIRRHGCKHHGRSVPRHS